MSDEFTREIVRRTVSRACVALDYKSAHASVLESLADIVEHYVKTLGETSQENAEMAGRANPGIHDFISALESQKVTRTSWKELRAFAFGNDKKTGQEATPIWSQPFPVDIPSYPISKAVAQPRHVEKSSDDAQKIAAHLPPYPPSRMYKRSSLESSRKRNMEDQDTDSSMHTARRIKRIHASKNIQQSLARLDPRNAIMSTTNKASSSSATFEGPALQSSGASAATQNQAVGGASSSLKVVLDSDSNFVESLPKEEKLLLGVAIQNEESKN